MKPYLHGALRLLTAGGAALLLSACGTASEAPTTVDASPTPQAPSHVLWAMEANGATTYLMGSVHALRSEDYPLPDALQGAYDDAAVVVMELAVNDLDVASMAATTQALGMLAPGDSLKNWLTPEDYADAARKSTALGLDLAMFDMLETWLAALTILNVQMLEAGFTPSAGIEAHYAAMAKQDGKPVLGLETLEEQLGIFDGMSRDEQARMLLNTLDDLSDLEDGLDTLVDAWKRGDTATLDKELKQGFDGLPGMYQALVVDRNRAFGEKITALDTAKGNHLVIVGALHLVGDDSVIALLKAQGHKLKRL